MLDWNPVHLLRISALSIDNNLAKISQAASKSFEGVVANWLHSPFKLLLQDATAGLSEATVDAADQKLHCSFVRDAVTTIETPVEATETITIDLVQNQ